MSQIQYYTEKYPVKRVYYTGSDTLYTGYALCYDRDNTTATRLAGSALGATVESFARHAYVEKPAAGNINDFAGVVSPDSDKVVGPAWITIIEPDSVGRAVNLFTEESCTIDVTLLGIKLGSYAFGSAGEGPVLAKALQTVDRSTTNGLVQAILFPVGAPSADVFAAEGRAATALPTAAIWDNFPLSSMRSNPLLGALLEADFRRSGEISEYRSVDAAETITIPATVLGELAVFATTDNQGAGIQWRVPIKVSGGARWGFEVRIKQSVITDAKAGWFVGLLDDLATGWLDIVADAGTLLDDDLVGFQAKEGDGDKVDAVYTKAGQTQNEHDDDYHTQVADTYFTLGMYYNGTTITLYLNGVASGDAISAADIAAADFPDGVVMNPTVALKNAHADDYTLTVDWIRVAQAPA